LKPIEFRETLKEFFVARPEKTRQGLKLGGVGDVQVNGSVLQGLKKPDRD